MDTAYTVKLEKMIKDLPSTSAWKRGVKDYAYELLDTLEDRAQQYGRLPKDESELEEWLLNGARNWAEYSRAGNALVYDCQIAERLCTPSELKRTDGGMLTPNRTESWLDVQTRALYQAYMAIVEKFRLL